MLHFGRVFKVWYSSTPKSAIQHLRLLIFPCDVVIDLKSKGTLTLPLSMEGGGGLSRPPKGFSSIPVEKHKLETPNFA